MENPPRQDHKLSLQVKRNRWLRDSKGRLCFLTLGNSGHWEEGCGLLMCHLPLLYPQFLQDTLDTLFGILDENSQKYGSKVFDSLVSLHFLNSITKECVPSNLDIRKAVSEMTT